jgi:hypothetical protein
MAATNYTPIQLYYSSTTTNVPLAANLASGELAINTFDGKLFYKDSTGVVQVIATKGAGSIGGSNTQIQFNNSGALGGSANLTWDGTYLTAGSIKNSALTSGRVTFAGASGLLSDSANLAWNGSTFAITGNLTATTDSIFSSTGALTISKGTTGERPTAASGMLRFNTTTTEFEGYNGTAWASVGGAALSNDTSTATDVYPLFANATTGTASTLFTGNAFLLYKPSTGELKSRVPVASNGIVVNSQTVATSYTIAAGFSGSSAGPITLSGGAVVTVSSGSRWVVL